MALFLISVALCYTVPLSNLVLDNALYICKCESNLGASSLLRYETSISVGRLAGCLLDASLATSRGANTE